MSQQGRFRSLPEWLRWLETLSPTEIELGLERVNEVLQRLQLRRPDKVIHVAGSNGKGSTVAMLEAVYRQRSAAVGSYTSPHIHRYNERIRIDGRPANDELILQAFARVEAARNDVPLTYFEYGTLAALCVFDSRHLNTLILEIGLGGRLDAVNAIEPDGGIVTNISLDHCAWLGDDVETIGLEKAGIFRRGKPFVFAASDMPQSVGRCADQVGARLWQLDRDYRYSIDLTGRWSYCGPELSLNDLQAPALHGEFQYRNAAGVLALIEAMQDTELLCAERLRASLADLRLPGRLQLLDRGGRWIVDVAHNPAAAAVLATELENIASACAVICIIGLLHDKDLPGIVEPLLGQVDTWISVTAGGPRAMPAADVARQIANLSDAPCLIADSIDAACDTAAALRSSADIVLVTGSFMTVGPALKWLEQ